MTVHEMFKSDLGKQADYGMLEVNEPLRMLRDISHRNVLGLRDTEESISSYMRDMWAAFKMVHENPDILDRYQVSMDVTYKSLNSAIKYKKIDRVERMLYYRANPWLFAMDVIGKEQIQKTVPVGTKFHDFTVFQKEFLRDALDPRRMKMVLRCNRGGSKTFLIGLSVLIAECLLPKLRVTIQGGSQEQSDKVYTDYFRSFIEGSVLEILVKGEIRKKHTSFIHDGWVKAMTASQKSVRGPRPDWLIIDEMCCTDHDFCNAAFGGVVTASKLKIIVSSTPDKMAHMFYEIDKKADPNLLINTPGWKRYHWDCYLCPWISEEMIEEARSLFDENNFRISMEGKFGSSTGLVFDLLTIEMAEVEEYPVHVTEWLHDETHTHGGIIQVGMGIDWGEAHPAVYMIVGVDDEDMMYILDSFGQSHMRTKDFRGQAIQKCREFRPYSLYTDSANSGENRNMRMDMYEAGLGIGVTPVRFGGYKYAMISEVRRRLEKGLIQICAKYGHNDKLLEQLKEYEWAPSNVETDGVSEKTVKINDDYIDALDLGAWTCKPGSVIVAKETSRMSGVSGLRIEQSETWRSRRKDDFRRRGPYGF